MEKEIKRKLTEGFAKIIEKKHTVTLLCEKAGVSRATFYLYYNDLNDFYEKTAQEITEKFFCQIILFMFCEDNELTNNIKNENLILNETEMKLLSFFADGSNYISFAVRGFEKSVPEFDDFCREKFGEEFFYENSFTLHYCLNAVSILLFLNLTDYNENKLLFEVSEARKIIKSLLH